MLEKKYRIPEEKKPKERSLKVQQVQRIPSRPLIHIPAPQKKINLQKCSSPTNTKIAPPVIRNPDKILPFEKTKPSATMRKISNKVERTSISNEQIKKINETKLTGNRPKTKITEKKKEMTKDPYATLKIPKKKK